MTSDIYAYQDFSADVTAWAHRQDAATMRAIADMLQKLTTKLLENRNHPSACR